MTTRSCQIFLSAPHFLLAAVACQEAQLQLINVAPICPRGAAHLLERARGFLPRLYIAFAASRMRPQGAWLEPLMPE
jgi:hypothetical protein